MIIFFSKITKKILKTPNESFLVGVRGVRRVRRVRTLVGNLLKYAPQTKILLEQFYHTVKHRKGMGNIWEVTATFQSHFGMGCIREHREKCFSKLL